MLLQGKLIAQYEKMHRRRHRYSGRFVNKYVETIVSIVSEIPTKSILDYGSGKGKQYTRDRIHEAWGVRPTLFDPGVPKINQLPEITFDGVICAGVLEHIPEKEIGVAIANLVRYADKWCFIIIGTKPTSKRLPDRRQAHVTLKPVEWWRDKLSAGFVGHARVWLGFAPYDRREGWLEPSSSYGTVRL